MNILHRFTYEILYSSEKTTIREALVDGEKISLTPQGTVRLPQGFQGGRVVIRASGPH